MAKDVYYFTHDFGARNDPKLLNLSRKHGLAGIGLFWCIIEILYEQAGEVELKHLDAIGFQLHDNDSIIHSVVNDFGLFETDGEVFWSESVNSRLEKRAEIAGKRRDAALNRWKRVAKKSKKGEEVPNKAQRKDVDYLKVVDLYHSLAPSFPAVTKLSQTRKDKIRIRLGEMGNDYKKVEAVFTKLEQSKFCKGDNNRGWRADFDWIFKNDSNWVKVLEGNYDKVNGKAENATKDVNQIWK